MSKTILIVYLRIQKWNELEHNEKQKLITFEIQTEFFFVYKFNSYKFHYLYPCACQNCENLSYFICILCKINTKTNMLNYVCQEISPEFCLDVRCFISMCWCNTTIILYIKSLNVNSFKLVIHAQLMTFVSWKLDIFWPFRSIRWKRQHHKYRCAKRVNAFVSSEYFFRLRFVFVLIIVLKSCHR